MTYEVYLASDNWAPAHPSILQYLVEVNEGYAPAYGTDSGPYKPKN